jgi:hypothetical protein
MAVVLAKIVASVLFGAIPLAMLLASEPPKHGSWWYPNPDRWDYYLKLQLYVMLDVNTPSHPAERWFVRAITAAVLAGTLTVIWLLPPCQ